MTYWKLTQTLIFDDIIRDHISFRYKAEIMQQGEVFCAEIWALNHYDVQPTFLANHLASEEIYVRETYAFDVYQQTYPSEQAAIDAVCAALEKVLGV